MPRPSVAVVVAAVMMAAAAGDGGGTAEAVAPVGARSVTLVQDGIAKLPILVGSAPAPAEELAEHLGRISGATFDVRPAKRGEAGIYVGVAGDFPWLKIDKDLTGLGPEGLLIRTTDDGSLLLIGGGPLGAQHAVTTLLHRLGCRWFFPGRTWEIVPAKRTLTITVDESQAPSFPTQRRLWYGYGAYPKGRTDRAAWVRHNRMGGPLDVSIGHTWHGLRPEKDFPQHPDWFALVEGERRPTKPCYSHPQVIERAIEAALRQAAAGKAMVSMTPPDGLGYCECDRCLAVFRGAEPVRKHSTLFATRDDGTVVNVTSETLFAMINRVAAAVAAEHPGTLIGCYAYSAYSHPPSFDLHPNVYLQTTTAYRRTDLSLEEQLTAFGRRTRQLGIREYFSVFQWDWDYPDPGKLTPSQLQASFRLYHRLGVTAVNGEASNNWGPRGLGYYLISQLLWNVDADTDALIRDFYQKAFGPAALSMQRYYTRWYGPEMQVLADSRPPPQRRPFRTRDGHDMDVLRAAYRDLDEAARAVADQPAYRDRVDHLRLYLHLMVLRRRLEQARRSDDRGAVLAAIRDETRFTGRLADTHLVHARALLGKAFLRRFRKFEAVLADVPDANKPGTGWRVVGEPPTRDEIDRIWAEDRAELGLE